MQMKIDIHKLFSWFQGRIGIMWTCHLVQLITLWTFIFSSLPDKTLLISLIFFLFFKLLMIFSSSSYLFQYMKVNFTMRHNIHCILKARYASESNFQSGCSLAMKSWGSDYKVKYQWFWQNLTFQLKSWGSNQAFWKFKGSKSFQGSNGYPGQYYVSYSETVYEFNNVYRTI
jgi:hypothetical protein